MDLQAPWTLVVAWLLVPALVVTASAGLGLLAQRASGARLGALCLPTGFLLGAVLIAVQLTLALPSILAVAICCGAALAGLADGTRRTPGRRMDRLARPRTRAWMWIWPALTAAAAYMAGLAPLAASGRSGVLGYVLNNDPSVHMAAVELLRDGGASAVGNPQSSYQHVSSLFEAGYPIGSHAWALFGSTVAGIDSFHIWSPLVAVVLAMTALTVYWVLRELRAPAGFSAAAAVVVACGYLPISYLAQGGMKEVMFAFATITTCAAFALAWREGISLRSLLPACVAVLGMISIFGLAAGAWLIPGLAVLAAALIVRPPATFTRASVAKRLSAAGAITAIVAIPLMIDAFQFLSSQSAAIEDPAQTGNLLGPVPWKQAFNIWFHPDYRYPLPLEQVTLNRALVVLAAAVAAIGLAYTLKRRMPAVILGLIVAVAGCKWIGGQYAIYFEAKTYVVLAYAIGLAGAAGVAAMVVRGGPTRIAGVAVAVALATGVAASYLMVYDSIWVSPKDRFQELIDMRPRIGAGPVLVNEREDYAKLFLRDSKPWESWGFWQPERGLRDGPIPAAMPHTPDFDDYTDTFIRRFPALLDRRHPGSRPPGNFKLASTSEHYAVWKRSGPAPAEHFPLGRADLSGTEPLNCGHPAVRRFIDAHAKLRFRLAVATDDPAVLPIEARTALPRPFGPAPQAGFARRDQRYASATAEVHLKRGIEYDVFVQGAFGPGFSHFIGDKLTGTVNQDLGTQDAWHDFGRFRATGNDVSTLFGATKPKLQSGNAHFDYIGATVFVPHAAPTRLVETGARGINGYCGKRLDWIEAL